jgi:signal transduction histidine kinase
MTASSVSLGAPRAERSELVSLTERLHWLSGLRIAIALAVLAVGALAPEIRTESLSAIAAISGGYLVASLAPTVAIRTRRRRALVVIGGTLLLDGLYLAWATYATGGVLSPLRFLVLVHVAAVTLAASYRTGFKLAAWHSLLLFVTLYAQSTGILVARETDVAALPGGEHFWSLAMLSIGAVWAVAVACAAFSSVNERELRAQKVDLDELSSMVREIDASPDASEISRVLLDDLCRVFGFTRGAVLAAPEGDLGVLAIRGAADASVTPEIPTERDPIVRRTLDERRVTLVRAVDAATDPGLAALFPGARNLVVVPMYVAGGERLGIVVLEHPGAGGIKRWVVRLVEQYVSHAALALRNTWLFLELQDELEENEALRRQLVVHNESLEEQVQERTRELSESLVDLRIADDERRRLLARLVDAQEDERQRVANDIHDDPLQKLAAMKMRLQLLRRRIDDPESVTMLDKLGETIGSTITSMRHMIFELRPTVLDEDGLGKALMQYLETMCDGLAFEVDDRLVREPPDELRVILYRIAQEALANVRKHAQASRVHIVLEDLDDGYLVRVEDDGVGFDPPEMLRSAPGHLGLSAMRERAEMVGGRCSVRSLPESGTSVEFWIPASAADVAATMDPFEVPDEELDGAISPFDFGPTSIIDREAEVV